jgi:hypothetical protein
MRILIGLILLLAGNVAAQTVSTCWPSEIGGIGGPATYSNFNVRGPVAGWHCPDGSDWLYAVRWGDVAGELKKALNAAQRLTSPADKQAAAAALLPFATRSLADVFDVWEEFATWRRIATEGDGIKDIPPTGSVLRFGIDDKWVVMPVYVTTFDCSAIAFGSDPAPGRGKVCDVARFVGQAIPHLDPPPPAPPAKAWRVKPNGTATTRPARRLDAATGVMTELLGKDAPRAAVKAPCDEQRPNKASVGGDVWMEFDKALPAVVAVCSLQ